jgi:hypothetical protein
MNLLSSLKNPRSIIHSHAILSSILEQIANESLNDIVTSTDISHDMMTDESAALASLMVATVLSFQYIYTAKFSKLDSIQEYTQSKKVVRTAISILVFIFMRNVESAI